MTKEEDKLCGSPENRAHVSNTLAVVNSWPIVAVLILIALTVIYTTLFLAIKKKKDEVPQFVIL